MTDELNPVRCGCGGEPYLKYDDGAYSVMCTKCGIETKGYCDHFDDFKSAKEYATKDWNKAMGADHFRDLTEMVERTAKVQKINGGVKTWEQCSRCYNEVYHRLPYCPGCGAKLDWGEQ